MDKIAQVVVEGGNIGWGSRYTAGHPLWIQLRPGNGAVTAGRQAHGNRFIRVKMIIKLQGVQYIIYTPEIAVIPSYGRFLRKQEEAVPFACIDALLKKLGAPVKLVFIVSDRANFPA